MKRTTHITALTIWTTAVFTVGWFTARSGNEAAARRLASAHQASEATDRAGLLGEDSNDRPCSPQSLDLAAPKILTAERMDSLAALATTSDAGAFALAATVGSLSHEDVRQLLDGLEGSGMAEDLQHHVRTLLRRQLARLDPVAALAEWTAKPLQDRDGTLDDIFFQLGLRNSRVAQEALAKLEPVFHDQAITCLVQGVAANSSVEGVHLAVRLGLQTDSPLVQGLADAWARREPEQAATAAVGLPDGWRDTILNTVMQNWTDTNAEAAFAWAKTQSVEVQACAWPAMVENLTSTQGPRAAVEWAETLPGGPFQQEALANSARRWACAEPEAASAWAASLPVGSIRDATAATLAVGIQQEDLPGAAAWVAAISDPATRKDAARDLISNWATQQTDATLSFFQSEAEGR